jgi:hypothetical protein
MSALMVNGLYPARTSEFVHVAKIAQQEVRVMIRCGQYRRVPIANICCSFAIPQRKSCSIPDKPSPECRPHVTWAPVQTAIPEEEATRLITVFSCQITALSTRK